MRIRILIAISLGFFLCGCSPKLNRGSVFYKMYRENSFYSIYSFEKDKIFTLDDIRSRFKSNYVTSVKLLNKSNLSFLILERDRNGAQLSVYDYPNQRVISEYFFNSRFEGVEPIDNGHVLLNDNKKIVSYNLMENSFEEIYELPHGSINQLFVNKGLLFIEFLSNKDSTRISYVMSYDIVNKSSRLIRDAVSGLCMSKARNELLFRDDKTGGLILYDIDDNRIEDLGVSTYKKGNQYCLISDQLLLISQGTNDIRNKFQLFSNEYRHIELLNLRSKTRAIIDRTYSAEVVYNNPVYFEEDITDLLDDMEN